MARDRLRIENDLREAEDLVGRVRGVSVDDAAQVLKDHADVRIVLAILAWWALRWSRTPPRPDDGARLDAMWRALRPEESGISAEAAAELHPSITRPDCRRTSDHSASLSGRGRGQHRQRDRKRAYRGHLISVWAAGFDSPYREITRPILKYVRDFPRGDQRDVVTVVIPEYVVGHWWEQLLHNQSALRLKARLLFQPGVVVIDVPWHLRSAGVPPAVAVEPAEGMDRRTPTGTEGVATGGQEPRDVLDTTTGA